MSAILALTAGLIMILIGILRKKKPVTGSVLVQRFIHPGHTWVRMTEDGDALVGLDEFGQSLIGSVDGLSLPRLLRSVRQGAGAFSVRHNDRTVTLVSPISGRITAKNAMVMHDPSLINSSPYGDGWLVRVRPHRLQPQLQNLFTGGVARQWQDTARARLSQLLSGTPALMCQDGGVLLNNLADRCSDVEWAKITKEVFLAQPTTNSN